MEPFATKGIEYLLVMGYLLTLVLYWLFLRSASPQRPRLARATAPRYRPPMRFSAWFDVPEKFHFHRGHTWALPSGDGTVRVGIDDLAQKLLGKPEALKLPSAGKRIKQGSPGWQFEVGGHSFGFLSPVAGKVVKVNQDALSAPGVVCEDPYGRGWLLEVQVKKVGDALKNLLPTRLARAWTEESAERLNQMMSGDLGVVLQDGGTPVPGFARHMAGERWPEIASDILMTG